MNKAAILAVAVIGASVTLFILGAIGPPVTVVGEYRLRTCALPSAAEHVWDSSREMITQESCARLGMPVEAVEKKYLRAHPVDTVIFFATLPIKRTHRVYLRWYQHLFGDLSIKFSSTDYVESLLAHGETRLNYSVVLGYRSNDSAVWHRLATGNVSRDLECGPNSWNYYRCSSFSFFELGSCHHPHYLVNLYFPALALDDDREYAGISAINQIDLFTIHQHPTFTERWFILKFVAFPLSLISILLLLSRFHKTGTSLIHRSLLFLNCCLVFYNIPVEVLSLWIDIPWMLVLNDFRQGLFIGALLAFWIIFVGEHAVSDGKEMSHVGAYWKQILLVAVCCILAFVYEFCERGIQALYPFYSIWANKSGRLVALVFVIVAVSFFAIYCLVLLVMAARTYRNVRRKMKESELMSSAAGQRNRVLLSHLFQFLLLTVVVAIISVCGYVLPSEMFLLQWIHGIGGLHLYSSLVFGNYGLWNAYVIAMTILYAPSLGEAIRCWKKCMLSSRTKCLKTIHCWKGFMLSSRKKSPIYPIHGLTSPHYFVLVSQQRS